ncbi:MAG: serine O-acetyltransferase [Solirubrobacterales bacterium]
MRLLDPHLLISARRRRFIGPQAHRLLRWTAGIEIPNEVEIGDDLAIRHGGYGLVIHPFTTIGDRVVLFQGVTVGRSDVWMPRSESPFAGIDIEDDVWICAGAKVIGKRGRLRVGRGTVVGANSVVLESTGEWEIWAGAPARKVGDRPQQLGFGRH